MGKNTLLSVLLALLAASSYCSSSQCPPQEDMPYYCFCQYNEGLEVECVGNRFNSTTIEEMVATLTEMFPANTTTLEHLEFKYFLKPSRLSSRIFEGLRIKKLHINGGVIVSWADEFGGPAFVGLEDCLEELNITFAIHLADEYDYRGETEMPAPFSLGHLRRLTKVRFYDNKLYVFGNDWFGNGGSSVHELDISENEIHFMGEEALAGLTNMQKFKAEVNKIQELTRSMFPNVSKLVDLELQFNKIERFPEDFFENFPFLKSIDLLGNRIQFLPENIFAKIWSQLTKFHLWMPPLNCDDHINWMLNVKQPEDLDVECDMLRDHDLVSILHERKQQGGTR